MVSGGDLIRWEYAVAVPIKAYNQASSWQLVNAADEDTLHTATQLTRIMAWAGAEGWEMVSAVDDMVFFKRVAIL